MAPKKKRPSKPTTSAIATQSVLLPGALADLQYIEPVRVRNRVIGIFEELFTRIARLERLHHDEEHG